MCQGDHTVTDYSIEFRTLAAECGWNSEAQWDMFLYGLSDSVEDGIYSLELPTGVDSLIDLAIWVDTRLQRFCWSLHRATFHPSLAKLCFSTSAS
ncbi:hypothetical protein M9458_035228, partial [Cirrhinus mrigala]